MNTAHTMQVACCLEPGSLVMEQRPRPVPAAGEALLRVRRIGVCGTDIHAFGGNQPYFSYPRVLGHELAGEIVAVADDLDASLVGSNAYVIPYLHCGECRACQRGHTNCCQHMQVIGVHRDGGMAEWLSVPVAHLVTSQHLSADELALIECQAIGAHAVRRSALLKDDLAVVVGTGPIGIGVAQIARASGARVVVVDTNSKRLDFCRDTLGFTHCLQVGKDDLETQISELNNGALADVVFDATGNPQAMEAGFALAGHAGRYVLVSIVKVDIRFHDPDFHGRELTLLASRNATLQDFERVTELLEQGDIQVSSMITHQGHFGELPELMPKWCQPGSGVIKAMIHLDE
uniref:zinc-binding alcohol dehydrogenase family protein n=1 Tax=Halomonas sp. TaxID=1486246 RepID=UPI003458D867